MYLLFFGCQLSGSKLFVVYLPGILWFCDVLCIVKEIIRIIVCRVLFLITEKRIHHLCLKRVIVTIIFVFFSIFFKQYIMYWKSQFVQTSTFFFYYFNFNKKKKQQIEMKNKNRLHCHIIQKLPSSLRKSSYWSSSSSSAGISANGSFACSAAFNSSRLFVRGSEILWSPVG